MYYYNTYIDNDNDNNKYLKTTNKLKCYKDISVISVISFISVISVISYLLVIRYIMYVF
jgi:hypothetical protein